VANAAEECITVPDLPSLACSSPSKQPSLGCIVCSLWTVMSSSVFESRNARARAREIGGWTQDVMTQGTGQNWGQLKLFFLRTKSFVGKNRPKTPVRPS